MKTAEEISVLDRASRAITDRIAARLAKQPFSDDPSYVLAMQHATDIVRTEIENIRDEW